MALNSGCLAVMGLSQRFAVLAHQTTILGECEGRPLRVALELMDGLLQGLYGLLDECGGLEGETAGDGSLWAEVMGAVEAELEILEAGVSP